MSKSAVKSPVAGGPREYAKYVSAPKNPNDSNEKTPRRQRHELRESLRQMTTLQRLKNCARVRQSVGKDVAITMRNGSASISGLQSCGSIWACPCCSAAIRTQRAQDIEAGVLNHLKAGGGAYFVTLTVRHHQGQRLSLLMDTVANSFRAILSGRRAKMMKDSLGIIGTIRALEITKGEAGWHPHLHILVLTAAPTSEAVALEIEEAWWPIWEKSVSKAGLSALRGPGIKSQGVYGSGEALSRYIAKVQDELGKDRSLGLEMARGDLKANRRKGRTPFQIGQDAALTGLCSDIDLWREYELATKGRQAITWSRGLRAIILPEDLEKSDEDIVNSDDDSDDVEILHVLSVDELRWVMALGCWIDLLEAAESGGAEAVRECLAMAGLEYHYYFVNPDL